jgi:hypothetical protein
MFSRAFPVSVFRAAGFSLREFSRFDVPRRAVDPAYDNGKCSSPTFLLMKRRGNKHEHSRSA